MPVYRNQDLAFDQKHILLNLDDQLGCLMNAVGERVRIHLALAHTEPTGHNSMKDEFPSCIAVHGDLECKFYEDKSGGNRVLFRVLSTQAEDKGTCYAYFGPEDIWVVADRRTTDKKTFDGGSILAIFLKGQLTHPYEDKVIYDTPIEDKGYGSGKTP